MSLEPKNVPQSHVCSTVFGVGIGSYFINRQLFIITRFAAFLLGKAGLAVLFTKTNEGPVNVLQYLRRW